MSEVPLYADAGDSGWMGRFVRPLVKMLFSTYGRVKGTAAVALARMTSSDHLCFWWHRSVLYTFRYIY